MKPSKLEFYDAPGAGLQIKATLHEEVPCCEFTLKDDCAQTVFEGIPLTHWKDKWFLVGCSPWIQFAPAKWSEMQKELFQQMVDAWNEKYATD